MFFIGCHGDKNILVPFLCCGKFFSGANFPVLVIFFICDLHVLYMCIFMLIIIITIDCIFFLFSWICFCTQKKNTNFAP